MTRHLVVDDGVDTDDVVGETGEQIRAISGPGQGGAGNSLLAISASHLDLIDEGLGLKVPDLDGLVGGSDQPVLHGGEDKGVDHILGLKSVQQLALGQVPKHGVTVFATGGAQGAIRRHGDGVEVAGVAHQVAGVLQGGGRPDLDEVVPTSRHEGGGASDRRETHGGNPVRVTTLSAGVLALAHGVPELHGTIAGSRDDLAVILGESDGQHILVVANEAGLALASANLPQTKGVIPRGGEGELAIGGDNDIGDEVVVATKSTASEAVVTLLAGQGPDDDSLRIASSKV